MRREITNGRVCSWYRYINYKFFSIPSFDYGSGSGFIGFCQAEEGEILVKVWRGRVDGVLVSGRWVAE